MFRPMRFRPLALAATLALLSPTFAQAQCLITGDSSLCNGPVQLCGPTGQYTYLWIDPSGQFSFGQCLTATASGTYMLQVTDAFGTTYGPCSKTIEASVLPPCTITGPITGCQGSTVELCGPQGQFTYQWSGPNAFASTAACVQVSATGTYQLSVWNAVNCPAATCQQTVTFSSCDTTPPPPPPPPPPTDPPVGCPRAAWFWLRQCMVSEHAAKRIGTQSFGDVAAGVDAAAGIFSWPNEADGFCATLHCHPATLRAQAKRQFATVLANVVAGDLGLTMDDRPIQLDRSAHINMRGISSTVGEWITATDAQLAQLETLQRLGRQARDQYRQIITVGWLINHGCGIGPVCGHSMTDSDRAQIAGGFVDDPEEPLAADLVDVTDETMVRVTGTPNPFSATTTVQYVVGDATEDVAIAVYDIAGRKVRDLASGSQAPGTHVAQWDGRGVDGTLVRSGVYFVRGTIGAQRLAGQLTFLR